MTYTNGMTFRPVLLSNVEGAYTTNAILILHRAAALHRLLWHPRRLRRTVLRDVACRHPFAALRPHLDLLLDSPNVVWKTKLCSFWRKSCIERQD